MRIEKHPVLTFDRGEKITIYYNGAPINAHKGETVLAALHNAGIRKLGEGERMHRPHGFFCATGDCGSCQMTVNDIHDVKICVLLCQQGMQITDQIGKGGKA